MSEFFAFASAHPFTAWLLSWMVIPIGFTVVRVVNIPFYYFWSAYNRRLRSINIRNRGWPTNPLMDADGDIRHPPAPKVEESKRNSRNG